MLEDLPQLVIQVAVIMRSGATLTRSVSVTVTAIMLALAILRKFFAWATHASGPTGKAFGATVNKIAMDTLSSPSPEDPLRVLEHVAQVLETQMQAEGDDKVTQEMTRLLEEVQRSANAVKAQA